MSARRGGATVTTAQVEGRKSAVLLRGEEEQSVERKKESLCYRMTSLTLWKSREESAARPETRGENEVTRKDPFSHRSS